MIRLNLFLTMATLLSAVYLVNVQYESRRLFTELDEAQKEATRLELEHDRLQTERRVRAAPARIERIAREELQMRVVAPDVTNYVNSTGLVTPGKGASQ